MDGTTGLDYCTVWEGHNIPAGFVFRVVEPKFKFSGIGIRSKVPKQPCEHWRFDDLENGLRGRLGNSLYEVV